MVKLRILLITVALLSSVGICQADSEEKHKGGLFSNIWENETLTDGFFGLNDRLSDSGIELGLGATQI